MERFYEHPNIKMTHPCQLFPHPRNSEFFDDIEGAKWDEFLTSIDEDGILSPIVTDIDGMIISGTQRWRAARQLGFEEVPVIERYYESEDAKLLELIKSNTQQRFTGNNEIKTARCVKEIRRICGLQTGGRPVEKTPEPSSGVSAVSVDIENQEPPSFIAGESVVPIEDIGEKTPEPSSGVSAPPTTKELAKMFGLGERQLQNLLKLLELTPELQDAVEEGKISVTVASRILARLDQESQTELLGELGAEVLGKIPMGELQKFVPQVKILNEEIESLKDEVKTSHREVYSESELDEATRKVEELEQEKRTLYEKYRSADKAHHEEMKSLQQKHKQETTKIIALQVHMAELERSKKAFREISKLETEDLKQLAGQIKEVSEFVAAVMELIEPVA